MEELKWKDIPNRGNGLSKRKGDQHRPSVLGGKQGWQGTLQLEAKGLECLREEVLFYSAGKVFEQRNNLSIDKRQSFK